mgnify:CR=1 FL=1
MHDHVKLTVYDLAKHKSVGKQKYRSTKFSAQWKKWGNREGEYSVGKQQCMKDRVKDGVSKMEIICKQCSIENDTDA